MVRRTFWMVAALAVAIGLAPEANSQESKPKDLVTTAVEAGSFKTLAAALQAAGLVDALKSPGPFTVFAPTDEAFAKLPAGTVETLLKPENKRQLVAVLTYHVVPGKVLAADVVKVKAAATVNGQRVDVKVDGNTVSIDDARVVKTDIACANGVIHVIDKVILPSSDSIPAVATKAGKFQTLLAAAKAAGLVEALSGDQPLTVFAPTDDAFAKLPAGTVESLLKPENKDQLAAILKYHVVAGRVFSSDLLDGADAKTLQGGALSAKVVNGKASVNGAGLVMVDIDAANGVIHVIDSVLLPPAGGDKGAHAAPKACGGGAAACSTTTRVAMHRGFGRRR